METFWMILAFFVIFKTHKYECYVSDPTFLTVPTMNSEILCDLLGSFNLTSVPMYEMLLPMTNSTEKRIILADFQKCIEEQGNVSYCNFVALMNHNVSANISLTFDIEERFFEFALKTKDYFPKEADNGSKFRLLCYDTSGSRIRHCVKEWLDFNETDSMCRNFDVLELCFNMVFEEYCKGTSAAVVLWLRDFRTVLQCPIAETIDPEFPSNVMEATRVNVNLGDSYTSFYHKSSRCLAKRNLTLEQANFCLVTSGGPFKKPIGNRNCKAQWTEIILPCKQNQSVVLQEAYEECQKNFWDDVKWDFAYATFQIICADISRILILLSTKGTRDCDERVLYADILCFREMKARLSPGEASVCRYFDIFQSCIQKNANQFCSANQYPAFVGYIGKRFLEIAACSPAVDNYEKETLRGLQRHVKLLVNAVGNVSQALMLLPKMYEVGKMDGCGFSDISSSCNQKAGFKQSNPFQAPGTHVDVCEEDQLCWKSVEEDLNRCYPTQNRGTLAAKFAMTYRRYLCDHFSQFLELENVNSVRALRVGKMSLPCHAMLETNIGNCTDSAILERSIDDGSICAPVKVIKDCVQKYYTDHCDNPDATSLVVDLVANISHQLECEKEDMDEFGIGSSVTYIGFAAAVVLGIGAVLAILFWKLQQTRKLIILSARERDYFLNGSKRRKSHVRKEHPNEGIPLTDTETDPSNLPYDKAKYEISENALKLDETRIIGAGNFGKVFKGTVERDGTEMDVAVKTLKQDNGIEKSYLMSLLTEIKIMMYIGKHPNIVSFVGAVTKNMMKGDIFVVSEYCPLGNLLNHLRLGRKTFVNQLGDGEFLTKANEKYANVFQREYKNLNVTPITSAHLINWAFQVAKGMMYLGEKKVIHSDLAARNVLLTKDRIAKITDFGLSRKLYHYSQYVKKSKEPLPWRWMAPESLADFTFTPQSDVWSYGILLWELFTLGNNPFGNCHWSDAFVSELRNGRRPAHPDFATEEIYNDVLLECWRFEAEERMTFNHICEYFHALKSCFDYEHEDQESQSESTSPRYHNSPLVQ